MRKSRVFPPYDKEGKPRFYQRNKSGVYLIYRKDSLYRPIYVGFSGTDLYKTMYRHFQKWDHKWQKVVTYHGQDLRDFRVRVVLCTPKQADALEKALILKHKPEDNPEKYEAYRADRYEKKQMETYVETAAENLEDFGISEEPPF